MKQSMKLLLLLCLFSAASWAENRSSNTGHCLVCHGSSLQGNVANSAPNLSILPDWYLSEQFNAFKHEWRAGDNHDIHGREMLAVAQSMTPKEIEEAVAFVKTKTAVKVVDNSVKGDIDHGKLLYQSCAACHGANGEGNAQIKAPPLADQFDWYIVKQLTAYRKGKRGFAAQDSTGLLMRQASSSLVSDQDVMDVATYINTLKHQ